MPKMKTNRGAAKRFKITANGKIRRNKAFASHLLTNKNTKKKRNFRRPGLVDQSNERAVRSLLPYGG